MPPRRPAVLLGAGAGMLEADLLVAVQIGYFFNLVYLFIILWLVMA